MDYRDYKASRNLAWEILLREDVRKLPVRPSALCRSMGISLAYGNQEQGSDGYSAVISGAMYIVIKRDKPASRIRFTIAHEIGHNMDRTRLLSMKRMSSPPGSWPRPVCCGGAVRRARRRSLSYAASVSSRHGSGRSAWRCFASGTSSWYRRLRGSCMRNFCHLSGSTVYDENRRDVSNLDTLLLMRSSVSDFSREQL